ncbi:MAG: Gfo/Idh/MocA family oxidoreductase [Armatimonadetes bacterium]|nr:Gfo/Idh/MocA family oxidoreductase [Armatimonadota bacterium]
MSQLNVALVGCGFMGRMHATVYGQLSDVKVTQCLSNHGKSSVDLAAKLGAQAVATYDEILRDTSIDVVDICLPTDLHADFAIKALKSGKHVLCEKPMAIDLDSADKMIAASRDSGKTLMVAQCIRFWPEYVRLREMIQDKRYGTLKSLQMTRFGAFPAWSADGWIGLAPRSGGAALDMHIHDTDYVVSVFGKPQDVSSRGTIDSRGPSHIFTLLTYPTHVVQTEGGWDLPSCTPFRMSFRAVFEQALVMFDGGPLTVYRDGEQPEPITDLPKMSAGDQGGNISDLGGYYFEMEYFYSCLKSGKPVTQSTPESSREALEITLTEIARMGAQL